MTSDFLAGPGADSTGRCACRCGRPITDRSPSSYFASELCSRRWHSAGQLARTVLLVRDEILVLLRQAVQELVTAVRPLLAGVQRMAAAVCADCAAQQGPADPMQRALWLRRNRNTGPRPPRRAPRRLDPAGGIAVVPLGRGPYRRIR